MSQQQQTIAEWEDEMRASADKNGGNVPTLLDAFLDDNKRLVRLADAKQDEASACTEMLLNGLIDDCRFLIKEVVFHSARLTPDANDRLRFLTVAKTLAVTGAKVGHAIAELRAGNVPSVAENRYRMIVEHVQSEPAAEPVPVPKGGKRERVEKSR